MKDIVLRVNAKEPKKTLTSQQSSRSRKLASTLEKSIDTTMRCGNFLYQKFSNHEHIITEPALFSLEDLPENRKVLDRRIKTIAVKKERRSGDRRKKLVFAVKSSAQKTHRSMRTPVGKLAIIQALAIAGLFVYVSSQKPSADATHLKTTSGQSAVSQKYLPAISQYTDPKAFNELLLAKKEDSLPVHTWLTPWNIQTLKDQKDTYASVSAFWLTVSSDGIHLHEKSDWKSWQEYAALPKKNSQKNYLTVSGDPNYTYLALSNPQTQEEHIGELLRIVQEQKFDGIDINYEGLGAENRNLYSEFIRNLTTVFHANNKLVAVTVEARLNNQVPMDWGSLGQIADEMRLMVYDYHSKNTGSPGPISPIGWLKEVMDYAQSTITNGNIVVGLGNYGYDWTKTIDTEGGTSWKGNGISFDQAMSLASEKNIPIVRATGIDERGYDIGSIPNFNYKDESDVEHSVWFEDNQSLQMKINLIKQYKTKGVIFWSVGLGDKAFWQTTISR